MIYFDCNANHPMLDCAKKGYLEGIKYNNISATMDKDALKLKEDLINFVSKHHGDKYKVILTSGGSESNSTIIYQLLYQRIISDTTPVVVCSTAEHSSVSNQLERLNEEGIIEVVWIKPNTRGFISPESIEKAHTNPDMIFIQSVNSETGSIQNITEISSIARSKKAILAIDNVQGFMKRKYPPNIGDFISISFHKIGGPIGFGALLIDNDIPFHPMIGGKQFDGMRGGTYNIGAISASLCAVKAYKYDKARENGVYFWDKLAKKMVIKDYDLLMNEEESPTGTYIIRINDTFSCLPHTAFFSVGQGIKVLCGTMVKNKLMEKGILVGNGSACNNESSTILGSMNSSEIHHAVKKGFIRVSFSEKNNKFEIDRLINQLKNL